MSSNYQQDIDKYSSMARYSIAILSALIVLFPSSNTFIRPPHVFDFLLPFAFATGIVAFLCHSFVILLRDTGKKRIFSDVMVSSSSWGVILTGITLLIISIYIFINIVGDRTSEPTISSLKIDPLNSQVNSLIQFTGEAKDEDSDYLTWVWEVRPKNEFYKEQPCPIEKNKLSSNLRTAHWIPQDPGKYKALVQVSDSWKKSRCQQITFSVN